MKGEVHVVVPASIDDPLRPSGGNVYDRRLCDELPAWGWTVREHPVPGAWPTPGAADRDRFTDLIDGLPDDSLVLVDGLIASAAEALVEASQRLRVVVLLHMPDATPDVESAVLAAAAGVITTSQWSRDRIISTANVSPDRAWSAVPGVDPAAPATGTTSGRNLLVVGPITPAKGHDVLVSALVRISDLDWRCTCAGSLGIDPEFAESVHATAADAGLADRFVLAGSLSRTALDEVRATTDLLIAPSRRESYGMAVIEALARGIPVVATDVGGHREALGRAPDGTAPGWLLPMDDVDALADVLRRWLTEPQLRDRWRESAKLRSRGLPGWIETARTVAAALEEIGGKPGSARADV